MGASRKGIGGKKGRSGGWGKKTAERHLLEGTYRRDRHGPRPIPRPPVQAAPVPPLTPSEQSAQSGLLQLATRALARRGLEPTDQLDPTSAYAAAVLIGSPEEADVDWAGLCELGMIRRINPKARENE